VRLPERQAQIYAFVLNFVRANGRSPSFRDVQAEFGFASVNSVQEHVRALRRRGLLRADLDGSRNIVPTAAGLGIPVYGSIPAGLPVDSETQADSELPITAEAFGRRSGSALFGLRVRGNSMLKAGIHHGDTVVLEPRAPQDGEIVAALIGQSSTLKRFVVRAGKPYLKAESDEFTDIIPSDDLVIQGVMVGLLRRGSR
jgi:repressor LexA